MRPRRNNDGFPLPARPVASIISDGWSTEGARDRLDEARAVMDKAGVKPGMTVADIGAGEGYYTVRLAKRVGDARAACWPRTSSRRCATASPNASRASSSTMSACGSAIPPIRACRPAASIAC